MGFKLRYVFQWNVLCLTRQQNVMFGETQRSSNRSSHTCTHTEYTHTHTHTRWRLKSLLHLLPCRLKCEEKINLFSFCRSWRLVSSHLRQVPVAGGRPGRADQDHRRRHSGSLRQLRLADVVPADVQRHGTQLEAVQTGGQYRGECILRWTVTKHTITTSMSRITVTAYREIIHLYWSRVFLDYCSAFGVQNRRYSPEEMWWNNHESEKDLPLMHLTKTWMILNKHICRNCLSMENTNPAWVTDNCRIYVKIYTPVFEVTSIRLFSVTNLGLRWKQAKLISQIN